MRREIKSLRIGVHHANAVVWEPVAAAAAASEPAHRRRRLVDRPERETPACVADDDDARAGSVFPAAGLRERADGRRRGDAAPGSARLTRSLLTRLTPPEALLPSFPAVSTHRAKDRVQTERALHDRVHDVVRADLTVDVPGHDDALGREPRETRYRSLVLVLQSQKIPAAVARVSGA
eukprot:30847-Pelagococcus_subviridis.AAC.8